MTKWKDFFPESQVNELTEGDLGWRAGNPLIQHIFQAFRQATINEVKRVLVPNGRFYVTEYKDNLKDTLKLLETSGFSCHSTRLTPEEMDKTKFLRLIRDKVTSKDFRDDRYWPYRIVTRK